MSTKRRLVIGMTGATGAVYTVRLLQVLQSCPDVETHLVISPSGVLNIKYEEQGTITMPAVGKLPLAKVAPTSRKLCT